MTYTNQTGFNTRSNAHGYIGFLGALLYPDAASLYTGDFSRVQILPRNIVPCGATKIMAETQL